MPFQLNRMASPMGKHGSTEPKARHTPFSAATGSATEKSGSGKPSADVACKKTFSPAHATNQRKSRTDQDLSGFFVGAAQ
jgi:hypothetical protein